LFVSSHITTAGLPYYTDRLARDSYCMFSASHGSSHPWKTFSQKRSCTY